MSLVFISRAAIGGAVALFGITAASAEEITVAAGAGFRRPIAEVAAAYEKASGNKVLQTYGHLGQVLAQARESGQIAVVCGDEAVLKPAKNLAFNRFAPLGYGKLVIAYRKGLKLDKPEDITSETFKRIGIPDQTSAVYGKAGRQFIERAKLANVDAKLVMVATVPQVTSYVVSGEVDAGFINATDAMGVGSNIGGFVEVPASFYDPAAIVCGVLEARKASAAANGFADFLTGGEARAILTRHGL